MLKRKETTAGRRRKSFEVGEGPTFGQALGKSNKLSCSRNSEALEEIGEGGCDTSKTRGDKHWLWMSNGWWAMLPPGFLAPPSSVVTLSTILL